MKSSETLLEVMEYGVTKAKAVRTLCDFFGIDIRDTIAFGDNYNDVDMLEAVGHGVVMGAILGTAVIVVGSNLINAIHGTKGGADDR